MGRAEIPIYNNDAREERATTNFFLHMIPPTVTAQEHKITVINGRPHIYDTPEIKDAKQKLLAHLSRHKPPEPYASAVRLIVKWCFPIKCSHRDGDWKTSKPDCDNLQKLLKDVMTSAGFWKDDALVCSEIVEKFWAATPGIYIRIEDLGENGY